MTNARKRVSSLYQPTSLNNLHPSDDTPQVTEMRVILTILTIIEKEQINHFSNTQLQFLRKRDVYHQGFS